MKHLILAAILLSVVAFVAVGCKSTETKELQPQTICPVEGAPINKAMFHDCKKAGVRIYACCEDCVKAIAADPEKHIKILEEKGQKPVSIP